MLPTIALRPMTPDDVDDVYIDWFHDPEVFRFLEVRNLTKPRALAYLREGLESGCRFQFIVQDAADDERIGTIKIGDIDWKHGTSDLVTVLGNRAYWGRGVAREAIRMAIDKAFGELGVRKLSASMYSSHLGSAKAYIAAGFLIEAVLFGQYLHEGQVVDKIIVSRFNPLLFPHLPHFPLPVHAPLTHR